MTTQGKRKAVTILGKSRQIRIYSGGREGTWLVAYRENGKRRFRRVTGSLADAEKIAGELLTALDDGTASSLGFAPTQRELEMFRSVIEQNNHPGGLVGLVADYHTAQKILGSLPDLPAMARHYAKTDPSSLKTGIVTEIVEEYLVSRSEDKPALSRSYLHLLGVTLRPFAREFKGSLSSIEAPDLQAWIKLRGEAKTQANAKGVIVGFFNWARVHKYLPREARLVTDDLVKIRRDVKGTTELHTPQHLRAALDGIEVQWKPFLAISAFAGVRSAEICRLDWGAVDLKKGTITIAADIAKTRSRRIVPILPALKAWLTPIKGKQGPIAPEGYAHEGRVAVGFQDALSAIKDSKGKQIVPTIKNGWRHSFISYRLETLDSKIAQVAMEAGNSESIIFTNYRELTDKPTAKKWFGITPK